MVLSFSNRSELILWVIDNYFYGYMYKMTDLICMNDENLATEITEVSKGDLKMFKKDNEYFLEYLC